MAKTRSMTRNHNHDDDDAFIRKRIKTWDTDSVALWSDLNHDVLNLVMMELGVIDFVSFSGVCKSWRSLALPNKIRFMASKQPMELLWTSEGSNNTKEYSLLDFGGRKFKIKLPGSGGRYFIGLTCGYLVLYGRKSCDFLLMNPITRHGIRFPTLPFNNDCFYYSTHGRLRVILVFSHSIFTWVLVVLCRLSNNIWFSIAGKGEWGFVSSSYNIIDVHEFKGKVYAIDIHSSLYELRLDLEPKLMLLNTKNSLGRYFLYREFVSSDENLYAMERFYGLYEYKFYKLDFGEMKWVSPEENSTKDFVFFVSDLRRGAAAIKPDLWSESNSWLHYKDMNHMISTFRDIGENIMVLMTGMWYFPHDCLKFNLKHE